MLRRLRNPRPALQAFAHDGARFFAIRRCTCVVAGACGLFVALLAVFPRQVSAVTFHPGCQMPFSAPTRHIDGVCDTAGAATTVKKRRANAAKNYFCAQGPAALVTQVTFRRLQAAAKNISNVPYGAHGRLPQVRRPLHDILTTSEGDVIGEGARVKYVGYVLEAHATNESSGESCNCNELGAEDNDIHITLGSGVTSTQCNGFTAEMNPHHRPSAWTAGALNATHGHPVRITGALFFDSEHAICKNGKRQDSNPSRNSLWEIHPVYSCDVCKHTSKADCPIDDDGVWDALQL